MRRAHRRPLIWSLAIRDLLGKVCWVIWEKHVGAVVDQRVLGRSWRNLGGSWWILAILAGFGPELAETCNVKADSEMRQKICKNVVLGGCTRGECVDTIVDQLVLGRFFADFGEFSA